MQRMKNALRDRRGETIVEVLVAFVLLMLFLALFTASLRFARRASAQAQTTRDVEIQTIQAKIKDDNDEAVATHTFTRYYKKVDEDKDDTKEDTTP